MYRVPGGLQAGSGEVALGAMGGLQEGPGRGGGSHDRFELAFSYVVWPSDALSLRFPILLGFPALSTYACAAKSSKAK